MDDSYWISSTERAWDSPYYKPGYDLVDSPYYAKPFYRRVVKFFDDEPKQSLWQCKYCGSTNKDGVIKCQSCNAPRPMETSLASVWGVSPKSTAEKYYIDPDLAHFEEKRSQLAVEIEGFKVALGEMFVAPFKKFLERIRHYEMA